MRKFGLLTIVILVLGMASSLFAWGSKEHIMLTRLAIERIIADPTAPADLKAWLKANTPDLMTFEQERVFFMTAHVGVEQRDDLKGFSYWVIQPDVRAAIDSQDEKAQRPTKPVPPLNIAERYWHFIDMEYLNEDVEKRAYHHDLSTMPDISKAPRDITDARYKESGVLPFAVDASYKELVQHIKAGKLNPPAGNPKDEDTALKWAASLMHYLEDNTQPLHGTQDYKCASYFENRLKSPNVHSQVEYAMNDDEKKPFATLRADYWAEFSRDLRMKNDPVGTNDLWLNTLQVALTNYKTIPLIGLAAMEATGTTGDPNAPNGRTKPFDTEKFFRFKSDVLGGKPVSYLEIKAQQQAWAVVRCAKIIRQAWEEAHK